MPLALTRRDPYVISDQNSFTAYFLVVPSGTYPTGGDAADFGGLIGYTDKQPIDVDIRGKAGFVYQYDYQNKKMFVYCNTAGGANAPLGEHTNIAYVAGVTGDVIIAMVRYAKQ